MRLCSYLGFLIVLPTVGLLGCGEGDFDQRLRTSVEESLDSAFQGINSNPGKSPFGALHGFASTGGPVSNARLLLFPVDEKGNVLEDEESILGDSLTSGALGFDFKPSPGSSGQEISEAEGRLIASRFSVSLRKAYRGPVIIALRSNQVAGTDSYYADPARAFSAPNKSFDQEAELLGYVLDFPFSNTTPVVSPLTTLVVERALFLGGASSGNLNIAARQVGAFFGLLQARRRLPNNLLQENFRDQDALNEDLAFAAIAQIALQAGVPSANVWKALRLDIRDDGELNSSLTIPIPGSSLFLPSLQSQNVIGQELLELGYLAPGNFENRSGITLSGSGVQAQLDFLNTERRFSDFSLTMEELSLESSVLRLAPGESRQLGLRAFSSLAGSRYLVVSSDGPSVSRYEALSGDLALCQFIGPGRIQVSESALPGRSCEIVIRLRPDGQTLTGNFDRSIKLRVVVTP